MSNKKLDDNQKLIFEYPLKSQVRGFLRLEYLFQQFERNRLANTCDNHLHALKILFEILEILERGDTRSELTKELSRLAEQFSTLKQSPEVDLKKLDHFLTQTSQLRQWVFNHKGKFGDKLRKEPFIESVKYRMSIPGASCQFDSPDLFLFLNQEDTIRQKQLKNWLDNIEGVKTSVDVILKIARDTGHWEKQTAAMGSYMLNTAELPLQLIRLKITNEQNLFPELSSGRHRCNIHFMRFNQQHRKIPNQEPVDFELACCQ